LNTKPLWHGGQTRLWFCCSVWKERTIHVLFSDCLSFDVFQSITQYLFVDQAMTFECSKIKIVIDITVPRNAN